MLSLTLLPCPLLQLWRWDPEAGPERRLQQLLLEEPHTVLCSEMVCSVSRWVRSGHLVLGGWGVGRDGLHGHSGWCAAGGGLLVYAGCRGWVRAGAWLALTLPACDNSRVCS